MNSAMCCASGSDSDAVGCECSRPFRVLASIEGRVEEVLMFGAVRVHPNVFHELLETVPAAGWQVVQDDSGLNVNLTGLRDPRLCESLGRRVRSGSKVWEWRCRASLFAPWMRSNAARPGKRPL